jgi:hypothetical protein
MKQLVFAVVGALTLAASAHGQVLYGISNGFGTAANNRIYQIDPISATVSNAVQVALPGFTVTNSLALAADPAGVLYAVLQVAGGGPDNRRLVTINPTTGVAADIGNLGRAFSSISFRSNGTLYGVTGDGSTLNPETLYTINPTTAAITLQFALGNGADGETIAFHPNGLLYHSSGNTTAFFESVNVDTQVVTPIGTAFGEMWAMGYHGGLNQLLGSDNGNDLFSINIATGARSVIGLLNIDNNRGLAFVPIPEPTSLILVGLGAAIGALRGRKLLRKNSA